MRKFNLNTGFYIYWNGSGLLIGMIRFKSYGLLEVNACYIDDSKNKANC